MEFTIAEKKFVAEVQKYAKDYPAPPVNPAHLRLNRNPLLRRERRQGIIDGMAWALHDSHTDFRSSELLVRTLVDICRDADKRG